MRRKKKKVQTKKERIESVLSGDETDVVPMVFEETHRIGETGEEQAKHTYQFYKKTDTDIIITPWLALYDMQLVEKDQFTVIPKDKWEQEESYLSTLSETVRGEVPLVWTIMSPLGCLLKKKSKEKTSYTEKEWKSLLTSITEETCRFVRHAVELGADGICLLVQHADYETMDEDFYREYGKPYDLAVLSASSGWCNIVSLSGQQMMFDLLKNYPVNIWYRDSRVKWPTVEEFSVLSTVCLMTGLSETAVKKGNKTEITHDIYEAIKMTGGRRLIMATSLMNDKNVSEKTFFIRRRTEEIKEVFKK